MEVPSNYTTFKVGFVNAQSGLRILKVEKKRLSDLKQKKTQEFELAELKAKSGAEVDKLNLKDKEKELRMVEAIINAVNYIS